MLKFEYDGLNKEKKVENEFSKKRENKKRIGVVILYEN
jgi:hypothetical protein